MRWFLFIIVCLPAFAGAAVPFEEAQQRFQTARPVRLDDAAELLHAKYNCDYVPRREGLLDFLRLNKVVQFQLRDHVLFSADLIFLTDLNGEFVGLQYIYGQARPRLNAIVRRENSGELIFEKIRLFAPEFSRPNEDNEVQAYSLCTPAPN